jgi:hypothetical protein
MSFEEKLNEAALKFSKTTINTLIAANHPVIPLLILYVKGIVTEEELIELENIKPDYSYVELINQKGRG